MPLLLDTTPADTAAVQLRSHNCIEIGLVNNMPDAALEATERQFVELIQAATNDIIVRLRRCRTFRAAIAAGRKPRRDTATLPNCGTAVSTAWW